MKWKITTLGEVVSANRGLIQTGPFGSQLHQSDYTPDGTPVIMPTDISDGRVSADRIAFVSEQTADRMSRHKLKPRTIVLPRRGDITKRAFIRDEQEGWLCGSGCLKIEVQDTELVPEFLYYFMDQHKAVQWLEQHAVGSTMLNLSAGIVNQFPVSYPNESTQARIASILSSYDDLIENNRRRMGLLERAARLLYEEWFVRLRFPGHEHTRITNGLPQGWERKPLSEVTSFLKRGVAPHYDDDAPGLVINQKCIRDGRLNMNLVRHQSREFAAQRQVQVGDVLVNSTGEGTLGRVAQVKAAPDNCTVDTHITIVRPKPEISIHYFGMAVMAWEPRFSTMGRGATNQTELSPAAIGEAAILIPHHSLLKEFEEFAVPISAQVSNLDTQNQKLRSARDLLLPRLMSGEIEVG
jgi:type I restriction enzyme S subunit